MANQRWKDKLRPASFRGVRFLVEAVAVEGGRRGPDFEFPDRDEPFAEDTGRRQRRYDIDAYLVGPDYFAAKKKLTQALEKKGPGDLVHPYYGRLRVVCRNFSVQETSLAGGFVKLSLRFAEAGSLAFPKVGKDSAFLVELAGKVLGESAAKAFEEAFNTAENAQFVLDSATDKLIDLAGKMDSIAAGITAAADPLAEFAYAVRNLKASAISLIQSPAALFNNIVDAFDLLFVAASPDQAFTFCKAFFSFGSSDPAIPLTTATRRTQAANLTAMNQAIRTIAVSHASLAAVSMSFKSVQDALAIQASITDEVDTLMETTPSDDVYTMLQNLRTQVTQAVSAQTQSLASVTTVVPQSVLSGTGAVNASGISGRALAVVTQTVPWFTIPSLVLSYDLYGSLDLEQDIIDRNRISHPGFIVGGQPLEVLDHG